MAISKAKATLKRRVPKLTPAQLRLVLLQEDTKRIQKELQEARKLEKALTPVAPEEKPKTAFINEESLTKVPAEVKDDLLDDANIVFRPNPGPQTDFLAATETEVLYGGARGGGKSYSLLVDPLRYCNLENHRGVLIRRTMPELRDLIAQSFKLYPKAFPGVKWREQEKVWTFPSGARIEFGYLETSQDLMRYQGNAYSWIGIDEVGQFGDYQTIKELLGSLRSVDQRVPTYFRCSANPGGVGSHWIREHFIDPAPANTTFHVPVDPDDPSSETISRRFIPARLYDNPYLTQTKAYENMLKSLPEIKRKQWLEGSWDTIEGAAFSEFDRNIHVVEPFQIPSNWPCFRACDWGFSSPFCVLWMAQDYDGVMFVYREFYGKGLTADIFAQKVRELERNDYVQYGVLDASCWARRGEIGPPIPEIMRQYGCIWRPSDRVGTRMGGSRVSGWMEVHRRLRIIEDANGNPTAKLKIFNTCRNLLRTLPVIPIDDNNPEDVNTKAEDHAVDALRYGLMSRPMDPGMMEIKQQVTRQESWRPASRVGY